MTKNGLITYFIQAEDGGPIKIGITADLKKRIQRLQTSHHSPLKVIATVEDDVEGSLHHKFKHLRLKGEWFKFDRELVDWICLNANVDRQIKTALRRRVRIPIEKEDDDYEDLEGRCDFVFEADPDGSWWGQSIDVLGHNPYYEQGGCESMCRLIALKTGKCGLSNDPDDDAPQLTEAQLNEMPDAEEPGCDRCDDQVGLMACRYCDCDFCLWERSMDGFLAYDNYVVRIGLLLDERKIFLICKPTSTAKRKGILDDFAAHGWTLADLHEPWETLLWTTFDPFGKDDWEWVDLNSLYFQLMAAGPGARLA